MAAMSPSGSASHAHGHGEPSRWVARWAHLIAAGGAVLDVASGAGRHARFLAARGHPVTALDRDAQALAALRDEPLVTTVVADLEGDAWPLPDEMTFAAVVVTNYLHRPLFPRLLASLAPGGALIYETFAQGNECVGKPSNPAFLLAPGELLDAVQGRMRVVAFQDGFLAQPRPAYVQRICAISDAARLTGRGPAGPPPCYELGG